jgi:hypothetical protein
METLPLPPEPAPAPPAPVSAHRRVLAAYDRIAEAARPELLPALRPCEEALVDAKAVDERVRAGEALPLAGLTGALTGLPTPDDKTVRRLTDAGLVVLGRSDPGVSAVALELVDTAIGAALPAVSIGTVALTPTRGLIPGAHAVVARTIADGQRVLAAITDSRAWPSAVRLSAVERPRIAVPAGTASEAFRKAVEDLVVTGARVETVGGTAFLDDPEFDALLVPAVDAPALGGLPAMTIPGVSVVARPFEDQVALDLAAFLHAEQVLAPYPDTGIDLVVFGTQLRGQPGNARLTDLGARFRGEVRTAARYRMVALPTNPPEPGILAAVEGTALTGERWTISPAGLEAFLDGLPGPVTAGEIELEDGSTAAGLHCSPPEGARDISEFGDWRAYLRHLTATRPMSG